MNVKLIKATRSDMETIWRMQIKAFSELLKKYRAIREAEKIHGVGNWSLDTILQEKGNLYLYEKMGYHQTGRIENINDRMDIVYYEKD